MKELCLLLTKCVWFRKRLTISQYILLHHITFYSFVVLWSEWIVWKFTSCYISHAVISLFYYFDFISSRKFLQISQEEELSPSLAKVSANNFHHAVKSYLITTIPNFQIQFFSSICQYFSNIIKPIL